MIRIKVLDKAVVGDKPLEPEFGQVLKVHASTCIDYLCDE